MKIYKNGKMYVEKNDLIYLERIPNVVFHEFENYFSFEPFIVFSHKESIDYFFNSFIINYDDIKVLSNEELREKILIIKKRLYVMELEWLKSNYKVKKELSSNIKRRSVVNYLNYQLETLNYYLNNRKFYDNLFNTYFYAKTLRM